MIYVKVVENFTADEITEIVENLLSDVSTTRSSKIRELHKLGFMSVYQIAKAMNERPAFVHNVIVHMK